MPSNTPITATVAEPVREKRPTLYGVLCKNDHDEMVITPLMPDRAMVEVVFERTLRRPGACLVTVPGECDDAPSGADPLPWKVQHKGGGIVAAFAWSDQANAYRERGAACGGWSASELEVVNTTPPGAKK